MKKHWHAWVIAIFCLGLVVSVSACSTPAPTATPMPKPTETFKITPLATLTPTLVKATLDGDSIVSNRCTQCHTLQRVTGAKKNRNDWVQTVNRMVPNMTADEQTILFDYLVKNYGP